jgi:diguanylate cyclase (GGDEF)-like protein
LEQLTQFHDDTINDSFFSFDNANKGLAQNELNYFIQKLLTTIDLPVLVELFFQQLQNTLQLSALKIQFNDATFSFEDADKASNIKTLSFFNQDQTIAIVSYGFNRILPIHDWQVLQQMHLCFRNPFKNALEFHRVKQFAMKDYLTSLGNRASFDEAMSRLISQAKRQGTEFGLLVLDLDNFKQVNDQLGHNEGDKVLVAFAETIKHCLRDTDFAFRFGGDEFCCLLEDSNGQANHLIAERIQQAVQQNSLLTKHGVSCSMGGTNFLAVDDESSIFGRADKALYTAKQHGRDCFKAA